MTSTIIDRLDGYAGENAVKSPCRVATTAAISLAGIQTIDGVSLVERDRVLVKDQANAVDNGIYNVASGNWVRSPDFDGALDVVGGTFLHVTDGTVNADSYWTVDGNGPVTIGTDDVVINPSSGNVTLQETLATAGVPNFSHSNTYLAGSVGERLSHTVYLTSDDFLGDPGATDNRDATLRMLDYLDSQGGGTGIIPAAPTPWQIDSTAGVIPVPTGVTITGQGYLSMDGGTTIEATGTAIKNTGTGYVFQFTTDNAVSVERIGFIGSAGAQGAIRIGTGTSDANQNGRSSIRHIRAQGFSANGAAALWLQSAQRAIIDDFLLGQNFTNIKVGANCGAIFSNGNVAGNNVSGYALDATVGGSGGVDLEFEKVYWESCPGQYPLKLMNNGVYRFRGRGFEAMCHNGASSISDPAIIYVGGGASLDLDVASMDFLSTGSGLTGLLSLFYFADSSKAKIRIQEAIMNFTGSRSGQTYKAFTGIGRATNVDIEILRAYGAGFADLAAVRKAYSPLINSTYTPLKTKSRILCFDQNTGATCTDIVDPPTIAVPNAGDTGSASGIAYPAVQTDAGSTSYTIDTLPTNSLSSGHEVVLEIAGYMTAGGGPGNMSATLDVVCSSTTTVAISAVTNTSRAFKAKVRLYFIARIQAELEVEYTDGTTTSFTRQALAIDNVSNTIALTVKATNAAAGDVTRVTTITMERH